MHIQHTQHCSRCSKVLVDPASCENGVGPICRGKNNHLLATTIPVNTAVASSLITSVHCSDLPEQTQSVWEVTQLMYFRQVQNFRNSHESWFAREGADVRDVVKNIDWILSFNVRRAIRSKLIQIVEALGYVGLASVLFGEASRTKAKVWFENGRLYLKGTANKRGWLTMRRIPNCRVPRHRGDKTPYSASWRHSEAFLNNVRRFWPIHDENLDELDEAAKLWGQNNPNDEAELPAVSTADAAIFKIGGLGFTVKLPWKGTRDEMMSTINQLKQIHHKERSFNPTSKEWTFKLQHFSRVKAVVGERYEIKREF